MTSRNKEKSLVHTLMEVKQTIKRVEIKRASLAVRFYQFVFLCRHLSPVPPQIVALFLRSTAFFHTRSRSSMHSSCYVNILIELCSNRNSKVYNIDKDENTIIIQLWKQRLIYTIFKYVSIILNSN